MCGRYSLTAPPDDVRALFGYGERPNFPPRYNIAPTQPIAVVTGEADGRHFLLARWGLLPSWVKDPKDFPLLVNARSETAAQKPTFRAAMRHRRCLVPANGFYEWGPGAGTRKQPYWCAPKDGHLVAFAGLMETYTDPNGSELDTATILTTPANRRLRPIHDRMPAVILPEDFAAWLDTVGVSAEEATKMLRPADDRLFEPVPVSLAVNRVANDRPELHERVAPPAPEPGVAPITAEVPPRRGRGKDKGKKDGGQFDLF
ncbi:MAG TPA: SOS response-associated peptidase [Hyphomicrobiales bacterium]|nr:SOS response-associated peptidase [Kaistiaceae bacterium]HQF31444.1 SOS response-associated peptidase [Hyphomicrobiales bacterium]